REVPEPGHVSRPSRSRVVLRTIQPVLRRAVLDSRTAGPGALRRGPHPPLRIDAELAVEPSGAPVPGSDRRENRGRERIPNGTVYRLRLCRRDPGNGGWLQG